MKHSAAIAVSGVVAILVFQWANGPGPSSWSRVVLSLVFIGVIGAAIYTLIANGPRSLVDLARKRRLSE